MFRRVGSASAWKTRSRTGLWLSIGLSIGGSELWRKAGQSGQRAVGQPGKQKGKRDIAYMADAFFVGVPVARLPDCPTAPPYWYRRACMGSTLEALRAGT